MKKTSQSTLKAFFSPAGSSGDPPKISEDSVLRKDQPASQPASQPEVTWDTLEGELEAELGKKRKWEQQGLFKRTGGRRANRKVGLQSRGVAGGWGSNRLYPGMQARRNDWSAAEAVDICNLMAGLKSEGASAAEVNRKLLEKVAAMPGAVKSSVKRVRALHRVCKKGLTFWQERLEKVEVGKFTQNKKGGVLKQVCKKSAAKGCRAPGGGRKDRFSCYKAAVKSVFWQELENGQEVARRLVSRFTQVCPQSSNRGGLVKD